MLTAQTTMSEVITIRFLSTFVTTVWNVSQTTNFISIFYVLFPKQTKSKFVQSVSLEWLFTLLLITNYITTSSSSSSMSTRFSGRNVDKISSNRKLFALYLIGIFFCWIIWCNCGPLSWLFSLQGIAISSTTQFS